MADRTATIEAGWVDALQGSLAAFSSLVRDERVATSWSDQSMLEGYTVGGIAGHVLSLTVGLHHRIESGPKSVPAIPCKEWFALALRPPQENVGDPRQMSAEAHSAVVEVGERFASQGATGVAADLDEISNALGTCLRESDSDMVIPLSAIKGSGIRLDDFLRTRFVEIVVHADDIASSVGITCPDFPEVAWTIAAGVMSETTDLPAANNASFVLDAARPGRAGTS